MSYLPCVEKEPEQQANAAVVWLHGLGADGNDFVPVIPHLAPSEGTHIRYIFPHAPRIPVTVNGGMQMPAWYDILEMNIDRSVDEDQLLLSAKAAQDLIQREIDRGIAPERIVLAGFSQGGAVAYEAALTSEHKLAGVMALSTYLATKDSVKPSGKQQNTPFLVQHGSMDPVVPVQLGEQAKDWLERNDYKVAWKTYPMQHQVCQPQLEDIRDWLQEVLPNPA